MTAGRPGPPPEAGGELEWHRPLPDDEGAQRTTDRFRRAFGTEPAGVWAAPGRVNLIGEHVDYAGGLCLPFALPHRTFVAAALREDGRVRLVSGQDGTRWEGTWDDVAPPASGLPAWARYAAGVGWALGRGALDVDLDLRGGLDLAVEGAVPLGAGLSSSAALEAAVAVALAELAAGRLGHAGSLPDDAGRRALARACVRAENEVAGAPTGGMDQVAALFGRPGHALLLDCRDLAVRPIPFDARAAGPAVLVIDTRVHHSLADGQYGARRADVEAAAATLALPDLRDATAAQVATLPGRLLARARHVVTEIERVRQAVELLDAGLPGALGPLLDASHTSLRDDYEVSCAELDLACRAARHAGALGARMTGGGFGGSALALVPAGSVERVAAAVAAAFAEGGLRPPAFALAEPSAGAGRVADAVDAGRG